jgi:hypothetical protein
MKANISRVKDNKYYILYKRTKDKGDTIPLYVIYNTEEYGGRMVSQFNTRREALKFFDRASIEATDYDNELGMTL